MEKLSKIFGHNIFIILSFIISIVIFWYYFQDVSMKNTKIFNEQIQMPSGNNDLPFLYTFNTPGTLYETRSTEVSRSPYWWLDSGGYLLISDGVGKTIQGNLPEADLWRTEYLKTNPIDTDNGFHPQNIFRLITKNKFRDFSEESYFNIKNINLSSSPNRNESNGILFFARYVDQNNLYYAGLRVDGFAVIKKKINGNYYTLGLKKILSGKTYDRDTNPNLLPLDTWIGLKLKISNNSDQSVNIKLFTDINKTDNWSLVLEAKDDGQKNNESTITNEGYAGIRTDFMDVEFENFRISKI